MVMKGILEIVLYSTGGQEEQSLLVGEGQSCKAIEIHPMEIHSVECITEKALMLEIKEGPFNPDFAEVMVDLGNA